MSYPPAEGYPTPATQPTVGIPAPAAPVYPPVSSNPYSAPPEPRRRPATQILAVAAAVLLVFGGLMLGLYLNEHGNLNDTKSTLRDTRADLGAQLQEQKTLNAQQAEKLAAAEKRANDL